MNFKLPIWLLYIWAMLNFNSVKSKQIERRRLRRSRNLERLCNNRVCNACGKFMNRFGKKHKKYQVSFSITMLVTGDGQKFCVLATSREFRIVTNNTSLINLQRLSPTKMVFDDNVSSALKDFILGG